MQDLLIHSSLSPFFDALTMGYIDSWKGRPIGLSKGFLRTGANKVRIYSWEGVLVLNVKGIKGHFQASEGHIKLL